MQIRSRDPYSPIPLLTFSRSDWLPPILTPITTHENVEALIISTTSFNENDVVAKTSYQMLGILSFSDRERAKP